MLMADTIQPEWESTESLDNNLSTSPPASKNPALVAGFFDAVDSGLAGHQFS